MRTGNAWWGAIIGLLIATTIVLAMTLGEVFLGRLRQLDGRLEDLRILQQNRSFAARGLAPAQQTLHRAAFLLRIVWFEGDLTEVLASRPSPGGKAGSALAQMYAQQITRIIDAVAQESRQQAPQFAKPPGEEPPCDGYWAHGSHLWSAVHPLGYHARRDFDTG